MITFVKPKPCMGTVAKGEFFDVHDSRNEKEQAHEMIERLAPSQVSAVVGLLQAMLDPVARAIANAPIDDEPVTPEEEQAMPNPASG